MELEKVLNKMQFLRVQAVANYTSNARVNKVEFIDSAINRTKSDLTTLRERSKLQS